MRAAFATAESRSNFTFPDLDNAESPGGEFSPLQLFQGRRFSDCRLFLSALKKTLLLLFATLTSAQGLAAEHDFRPLGPFGGDVRSLAVHPGNPNLFYLGTSDGQIYSSADGGQEWTKLHPGLGRRDVVVDNLHFHPNDADTLYAATWELHNNRGWLFRSKDKGQTWSHLPTGEYFSQIRAIAIAPSDPNKIALGIAEGVLLSDDEGANWQRITRGYRSLHNVESLAFDPIDSQTLYVGTWRLGWKTNNLGKSWEAMHSGMLFDSDMFSLLVNPNQPSQLFASACTGIYRSPNAGQQWNKLTKGLPSEAKRTRTLHFDPSTPDVIYAGTTAGLYVTQNGGDSWGLVIPDIVVNAVSVSPSNSDLILVGTDDEGVLRSSDGGASFSSANRGFIHRQIPAIALAPGASDALLASVALDGAHGGLIISTDEGMSWKQHNTGLSGVEAYIRTILPAQEGSEVYLGTSQGIFRSDLSNPWERLPGTVQLSVQDMVFSTSREGELLVVSEGRFFRSRLGKSSFEEIEIEILDGRVNSILADHAVGAVYLAADIGILKSMDDGDNWSMTVDGLPPLPVNILAKAGRQLFAGTRNGLFVSQNSGQKWTRADDVFPLDITALVIDPENPNRVLAADSAGGFLFESRDGGQRWSSHNSPQRSRVLDLVFTPGGKLLAGTLSEGIYLLTPRPTPAAVDEN